jgi:bifunctional NMN adenylyltransferase/nudix hydrolase
MVSQLLSYLTPQVKRSAQMKPFWRTCARYFIILPSEDVTMHRIDVAVLIGRFQPFHQGHASLLTLALSTADKVIVVLGSAFCARSVRNPFTWQERAAIISASLSEADQARVSFIPVRDYYDDLRWANAVRISVMQTLAMQGGDVLHIALIGCKKDASGYYLQHVRNGNG